MKRLIEQTACDHGYYQRHVVDPCSGPCLIPQDHDTCRGGTRELLDFDAIWTRYREAVMWADLTLTYDELKQVVLGGTKT